MGDQERNQRACGALDMLRYVIDRPRVVVADFVNPKLLYGRQTVDEVAPREEWLLVFGACVDGPCEWSAVQLVVGDFEVGVLCPTLVYAIPPRQSYRLSTFGHYHTFPEYMLDKNLSVLPGRFRLLGWRFGDMDYMSWLQERA